MGRINWTCLAKLWSLMVRSKRARCSTFRRLGCLTGSDGSDNGGLDSDPTVIMHFAFGIRLFSIPTIVVACVHLVIVYAENHGGLVS